jgi:hypothetical protein
MLGKEYRSFSSSLCNFHNSPVTLFLLGPNTLLNILFSNTFSLHSSFNVSDQVSHPYKTKGTKSCRNLESCCFNSTSLYSYTNLSYLNTGFKHINRLILWITSHSPTFVFFLPWYRFLFLPVQFTSLSR